MGHFPASPLPHYIHVLLLTNSPGFPHISSAPSLPAGAGASFSTQMFWSSAEVGPSCSQSHSPLRLPCSEVQGTAELGWERAAGLIQLQHWDGVARSFPVTSSPPLGLHWGGGTLRPDPQPPLPTRSTLIPREEHGSSAEIQHTLKGIFPGKTQLGAPQGLTPAVGSPCPALLRSTTPARGPARLPARSAPAPPRSPAPARTGRGSAAQGRA